MIRPDFRRFQAWARSFDVVPLWIGPLPFPARDLYPHYLNLPDPTDTFFLDGFRAGAGARWSMLPLSACRSVLTAADAGSLPAAWSKLERRLSRSKGPRLGGGLPPFYGGAVGFLGYDCGRLFERGWRSAAPPDPLRAPLLRFGFYDDIACFDHRRDRLYLFSCLRLKGRHRRSLKAAYARQKSKLEAISKRFLRRGPRRPPAPPPFRRALAARADARRRRWYVGCVRRIQKWIAAGDIYQANLSQRMDAPLAAGRGREFYAALRRINPSPYACYLRCGGVEIASCSPELLLKKTGETVETGPIAGTRPRGRDAAQDRRLKGELLLSEKERAEHVMLLDLERNDLGRVCRAGSVRVRERMSVQSYSHVMHIVSYVRGRLRRGESFLSALSAVFPGGTITGCPKIRCMEILDAIEPVARGPFYGSAGWIGYQGDGEMNLLIRTGLIQGRKIFFQVGSGIVADSDPAREYEESLHKARALSAALQRL